MNIDITTYKIHDAVFKLAFKQEEVMRAFLEERLDNKVRNRVNLDTLKLENCSFVSEELSQHHSDVIYSMEIDGKKGYLYILLEAQSGEDELMAVRLLEYDVKIIKHAMSNGAKSIPPIINLVLYSGEKEYKGARSIVDAFADKELGISMFTQNFLIDLNREEDRKILMQGNAALVQLLLKHGGKKDMDKFIEENQELVGELLEKSKYYVGAAVYIASNSKKDSKELLAKIPKLGAEKKKEIMSGLQRMITKGKQEGIHEGMLKGKKVGMQEGMIKGKQEGIHEGMIKSTKLWEAKILEFQKEGILPPETVDRLLKK